jgi:tetratricopeptide (TPR) repeat protein
MALRFATIDPAPEPARSPAEWRALVEQALADAAAALRTGDLEGVRAVFDRVAAWEDGQRAYQARRQLAELVLGSGELVSDLSWTGPYAVAAEGLVAALEDRPAEPVLLNYAGVLLYELVELEAARACFEAVRRLDPEHEHLEANLAAVARRERTRPQLELGALAARVRATAARATRAAEAARAAEGLTLSLAMIVRDEEEMLPGCLEAVRGVVDELVVVDTGSTDRTMEIAESFGAKVVRFPWNGSFADARNVSLEHATGDWILYLDADEHLVPEDAPALRALLGKTWREAFYLVETNYLGGEESGHAVTHMALRLFRNRPAYRFEGRIHEQKAQSMPTFLPERFEHTTIRLRHYGYLKGRIDARDKSRRNLELLEQERREAPSPFNAFNLGSEYMALGDWAKARAYLDEAWEELRTASGFAGIPYAPLLVARAARARREDGDGPGARAVIADGLRHFPDHTDLVFEEAVLAREEGELDRAAALAERCLQMGDAPATYAATVGAGSHLALVLLAEVRVAQGRLAEAEELYRRSLAEHPEFVAPVLRLAALMLRRDASEEAVEAAVPLTGAAAMLLLATAFHEAGRHEAAERWFRRLLARQPTNDVARIGLAEALLAQRRYDDAVAEASLVPEGSPLRPLAALPALFAAAVRGDAAGLAGALAAAEPAGTGSADLELYRAWQRLLAGERPPAYLSGSVLAPLSTVLEAALRVHAFEGFEQLVSLLPLALPDERRRRELLARLYLRLGFLDSAAEEWAAVCDAGPDAAAFLGLAQVALARGAVEDVRAFAEIALELEPGDATARRLLDAAAARGAVGAAA